MGKSKRMGRFVVVGPNRPVSEVVAPYVLDFIIGKLDRWFRIFFQNTLSHFAGYWQIQRPSFKIIAIRFVGNFFILHVLCSPVGLNLDGEVSSNIVFMWGTEILEMQKGLWVIS
jgi:hypothetical protein